MMLERKDLRKITSSAHIESHSIGLTVADIQEVVGVPTLADGEVDADSRSVGMHQGAWKLSMGTYYLVFNESVTFQTNDQVGVLLPHTNVIRCGGVVPPRLLEPSGPREIRATLYTPGRMQVDAETPVATLVVFEQ